MRTTGASNVCGSVLLSEGIMSVLLTSGSWEAFASYELGSLARIRSIQFLKKRRLADKGSVTPVIPMTVQRHPNTCHKK